MLNAYANAIYAIINNASTLFSPHLDYSSTRRLTVHLRRRRPRLEQRLATRSTLLEALLPREDPLSTEERLLYDTLERLILVRADLVTEQHRARLDLTIVSIRPSSLMLA